ncbi:MAG: HtaA domain-containing protein [Baekduia sp.]
MHRPLALALATPLCSLLIAGGASASDVAQTTTWALGGSASKGFTAAAVKPAKKNGAAIVLGWTGSAPSYKHSGAIRLKAGARSVLLSQLRYVKARDRTLTARIGRGKTIVLARLSRTRTTAAVLAGGASAIVATSDATLTLAARSALTDALRLSRIRPGRFASVRWIGPAIPATPPDPGQPQPENPVSGCAGGPAPLPRPATAATVTAAQMTWRVRESFIRYINGGQGSAAADGATAGAPLVIAPSADPLVYDYSYAYRDGWSDPASGQMRLLFTGRVTFKWAAHGIDLALTDPEIEISPSGSRAVFCMVNYANPGETLKRSTLVTLDTSGGTAKMNGTVPAGAAEGTFAGYYFPGDPFGSIGLSGV